MTVLACVYFLVILAALPPLSKPHAFPDISLLAGSEAQSGLREPLLPGVASEGALSFKTPSRQASQTAATGQQGGVRFVPAHALMDNAPAVSANEGRLGQAWLVEPQVGGWQWGLKIRPRNINFVCVSVQTTFGGFMFAATTD